MQTLLPQLWFRGYSAGRLPAVCGRYLAGVILSVLVSVSAPAMAASELLSPADKAFALQLEQELIWPIAKDTPGAAVVVVVDGKVVLERTYGVREQGKGEPITNQTLFRVASLSKTFASAAAAILVHEAPITWQTPVHEYLRELNFKRADYGEQINIRHLLSQTSGLMPHAYTNLVEDRMSYPQIVRRLDRVDFVCEPGECYGYQNVVFSLVGDVVAAHSGQEYPAFVTDRIFTPLGMTRASFGRQAFISDSNHALPHVRSGGGWRTTRTTNHYYKVPPAAGVNASISDMKAWLLAQMGQHPVVLSSTMLDEMHTRVIPTTRSQAHYRYRRGLSNTGYGLGWRVFDYGDETNVVHHGGYVRGMRSEMVFDRSRQTGLVFLTNSEPGVINDLVFDFIDLYQARRPAIEPSPAKTVAIAAGG